MKEILSAIKEQLPQQIEGIRDIEIIPDPAMVPERVRFPFIGIKDGDIKSGGGLDPITTYEVRLYVYVQIKKPEASIIGTKDEVGVLELADSVLAGLEALGNLGIDEIFSWEAGSVSYASALGQAEAGFVQYKEVRFYYKKNA